MNLFWASKVITLQLDSRRWNHGFFLSPASLNVITWSADNSKPIQVYKVSLLGKIKLKKAIIINFRGDQPGFKKNKLIYFPKKSIFAILTCENKYKIEVITLGYTLYLANFR